MDEARRSLRYVLPGLIAVVEVGLILLILAPHTIPAIASRVPAESALAAALAGLLATGALGFILGTLHHAIHWHLEDGVMNHVATIEALWRSKHLSLRTLDNVDIALRTLSRREAWIVTSALWYQRRELSKRIQAADDNARHLTDLAHTLGTIRIASIIAALVAFLVAALSSNLSAQPAAITRFAIALLAAILFVVTSWNSYLRTAELARAMIDEVLADAIAIEEAPKPAVTYPSFA